MSIIDIGLIVLIPVAFTIAALIVRTKFSR